MRCAVLSSLRFAALAGMLALLPQSALLAQQTPPRPEAEAPPAVNPGEDFNRQFTELKQQLEALGGKIKQSAGEIEALTSPDAARQKITTLQGLIANTLGLVTDNGKVAMLGKQVIDYARTKQKQFESSNKFTPEERQYLQREWAKVGEQTKAAIADLSGARSRLTNMLKTVQTRGDYIQELEALNNAKKMLEVVRALAAELRSASTALENFSRNAKPPAPGT